MLIDQSLAGFAGAAAARSPTPGGGSVSAYLGVLGAALGSMAARYTEGRKGFEQHADAVTSEIARLEALRDELSALVDEDAGAYERVSAAYALPKATEAEQAARREAVRLALSGALEVPLRIARAALSGLEVLESLGAHVNPNLASDVAVGAHALAAALRGAWVNVLVNLAGLRDEARSRELLGEGRALLERCRELEERVSGPIVARLGG
ncbi:MAG TPA: cyclodeaminase/cyclohydrolase family protein, partial [Planctomycetota bacterium]|nr:cyclodeaminase/cyclohydrolase family protein [Planctomycetota bacterium]